MDWSALKLNYAWEHQIARAGSGYVQLLKKKQVNEHFIKVLEYLSKI